MKKVLIASGAAILAFTMIASAQGYTFNTNLTVGSTGPDVVALQTWLVSNNYLTMPAGVSTGYFGSRTKAAVQAYQTAKGLPSTGFVGPLTRGTLNAGGGVAVTTTTTFNCPAGYTCTANPGTTGTNGTTGTGSTGITTPGVPGIMSVTAGPLSSSVMNVGAKMVPVLAARVQAQYSDIDVQSLTVDLGPNTASFNKIFNTIYVTNGTSVLASQPLNGSTVVQSGSDYVVGLAGFHFIVPKGTYKDLIIKADVNTSIDSAYISGSKLQGVVSIAGGSNNLTGWGFALAANSLRGVDGAGLNLYGPSTNVVQAVTVNASLVDNAQANISLDPTTPVVASVPVSDTTNNQYLGLPVLTFGVNAQNDTLHLHEVKVHFATSGTGNLTAAYLYQGSTQVQSASVSGGVADFANITDGTNGASIPVNTTVPFTVKVDVTGVTSAASPFNVSGFVSGTTTSDVTVYNSIDGTSINSGSAAGNQVTVASVGPLFTLTGTPSITKTVLSTDTSGNATTSYSATFNVQVQAVGTDVALGLPASTTPMFTGSGFTNVAYATTSIGIYKNGSQDGLTNYSANNNGDKAVTANFSQPTGTALSSNGTYFTVSRNSTVTVPVTITWLVRNAGSNTYSAQLQGINWFGSTSGGPSTFMANQPAWRTNAI